MVIIYTLSVSFIDMNIFSYYIPIESVRHDDFMVVVTESMRHDSCKLSLYFHDSREITVCIF